jgi:hypothetical protein
MHTHTRSQKKDRWQLVTQLLTNHNMQRGQNTNTQYTQTHNSLCAIVCLCVFYIGILAPLCVVVCEQLSPIATCVSSGF